MIHEAVFLYQTGIKIYHDDDKFKYDAQFNVVSKCIVSEDFVIRNI